MKQEIAEFASAAGKGGVVAIAAGSIFGFTLPEAAAFAALIYTSLLIVGWLFDRTRAAIRWFRNRKVPQP